MKFDENQIKIIVRQILLGLNHCHSKGYIHRDIKPDNILISSFTYKVKICDFGISLHEREMDENEQYFCTRFYRSPELLLGSLSSGVKYSQKTDVWSVGVIMAELYLQEPLFSGENDKDMLFLISQVIEVPLDITNMFEPTEKTPLCQVLPNASKDSIDFLSKILKWDPLKRFSSQEALNHPFLKINQ